MSTSKPGVPESSPAPGANDAADRMLDTAAIDVHGITDRDRADELVQSVTSKSVAAVDKGIAARAGVAKSAASATAAAKAAREAASGAARDAAKGAAASGASPALGAAADTGSAEAVAETVPEGIAARAASSGSPSRPQDAAGADSASSTTAGRQTPVRPTPGRPSAWVSTTAPGREPVSDSPAGNGAANGNGNGNGSANGNGNGNGAAAAAAVAASSAATSAARSVFVNGDAESQRSSATTRPGQEGVGSSSPTDRAGATAAKTAVTDPARPVRPVNPSDRLGEMTDSRPALRSTPQSSVPSGTTTARTLAAAGAGAAVADAGSAMGQTRPMAANTGGLSNGVSTTSAATTSPAVSVASADPRASHGPVAAPSAPAQMQAAPSVAAPAAVATAGPRTVRLTVARVNPWSVLKLSFLLSVALGIAFFVATILLWQLLNGLGLFTSLDRTISAIGTGSFDLYDYVGLNRVVSVAVLVSVLNVIIATALATLVAFLYNVGSGLVGGLEVTLADD